MKRLCDANTPLGFNPLRDVAEVMDGLAVDVTDMLRTGVVKDAGESLDNNGIDDPNNIIGLVRDEFAAIDAQRAIKKYGRRNKPVVQKAVETATTVADNKPADS